MSELALDCSKEYYLRLLPQVLEAVQAGQCGKALDLAAITGPLFSTCVPNLQVGVRESRFWATRGALFFLSW